MTHPTTHPTTGPPTGSDRFKRLPGRTPLEQLRTSHDADPPHDDGDDRWRETQWLLRTAVG